MIPMKPKILLICICAFTLAVAGCTSPGSEGVHNQSSPINNATISQITPGQSDITNPQYEDSGRCYHVVDGDTIDVEGVGRIRLVGVNTPEKGQPGYQEAKDFMKNMCLDKTVDLDIDDEKPYDKYDRVLAVVYVDGVNLNMELLKRGYAEVMFIPPSEFDPYLWN